MKFYPRSNSFFEDAFDDMFRSPFFTSSNDMCMKTDITEKDGNYLLDMELPGCRKEDIHLELNDGYLNISAARNSTQERYSGSFSRSFYVGENIKEEDIRASYDNGELKITFPKEVEKVPERKTIMIE